MSLKFKDFPVPKLSSTWEIERIDVQEEQGLSPQTEMRTLQKKALYKATR